MLTEISIYVTVIVNLQTNMEQQHTQTAHKHMLSPLLWLLFVVTITAQHFCTAGIMLVGVIELNEKNLP